MQLFYADRVRETSTTTGTGTYTLAGAVAGNQSFAAIGNGIKCFYCAENGVDWEVGIGTYTAAGTLLARTQIIASSNANAAVNWAAGTRNVYNVQPAAAVLAFGFDVAGLSAANAPIVIGARGIAIGSLAETDGADGIAIGTGSYAKYAGSVAIGQTAWANGINAVSIGNFSSSTPAYAVNIAAGAQRGANGPGAVAIAGDRFYPGGSTSAGTDSVNIGGSYNDTNTAVCATAIGYAARPHFFGALAQGGGDRTSTAIQGAAQCERVIQRITTTNGTTTPLEIDAAAATLGYLTFPANFDCAVIVHVVGRQATTGDSIAFRLEGLLHSNGSSVPSLVGTPPAAVDLGHAAGAAAWTAALAVDAATHNCLLVNVTGEAAKTIKWVARIELVEVGA